MPSATSAAISVIAARSGATVIGSVGRIGRGRRMPAEVDGQNSPSKRPIARLLVERHHPLHEPDELAQAGDRAVVVDAEALDVPGPHAAAEPEREPPAREPVEVERGHRRLQRAAHERHRDARRQLDVLVARRGGAERGPRRGEDLRHEDAGDAGRAQPVDLVADRRQAALGRNAQWWAARTRPRHRVAIPPSAPSLAAVGRRTGRAGPVSVRRVTGAAAPHSCTLAGRLSTAATASSTTTPPAACTSVTGSSWIGHAAPIATMFIASRISDDRAAGMKRWAQLIIVWPTMPTTTATNSRYSQSAPASWR